MKGIYASFSTRIYGVDRTSTKGTGKFRNVEGRFNTRSPHGSWTPDVKQGTALYDYV